MFKAVKIVVLALVLVMGFGAATASAQDLSDTVRYSRGKVVSVQKNPSGMSTASVQLQTGNFKGTTVKAVIGVPPSSLDLALPVYKPGDKVIVSQQTLEGGVPTYTVIDHDRLTFAAGLLVAILMLAVIFAGWRGFGSLLGLVLSVVVLVGFVVPQIVHGQNPYLMTAAGIAVIACLGIFLAHGFSKRTGLALLGTGITLVVAVLLATLVVHGLHLTGVTDENTFYLAQAQPHLHLQSLLLCGLLISLVGVLDDITVGQATSVEELYRANRTFSVAEAYRRGLRIGREHIASLVNTLVLVFIGGSLLLVTYLAVLSPYPWYVNLNSGIVMQEIARALVGSIALILAVPITTFLAARFLKPTEQTPESKVESQKAESPNHTTVVSTKAEKSSKKKGKSLHSVRRPGLQSR